MFSSGKFFASPPAATPTDPYFNYTTLLLNDTGTNGAQNNTFVDSSTNNFSITRTGNTTQGSFNPYEPTGSWAGYFGGTQYLSISNTNPTTTFGSGNFTIEAWIFLTSTNISQTIVGLWNYTNSRRSWELATSTTGTLRIRYSTTGSDNLGAVGTTAVPTNQWVHVAFVRNGTSLIGYLNGVNSVSVTTSSSLYANTLDPVRIAYSGDGGFTLPLTGYISNVRVVNGTAVYTANFTPPTAGLTAISGTSILCLQSNRFIDNSSNNFYIAPSGPPSVTGFNPFAPTASYTTSAYGGSAYFDGAGDYLTVPSNAAFSFGTGDFTVEFWMYMTSYGSDNQNIIDFRGSAGFPQVNIAIYLENVSGTGTKQLRLWNGSADAAATVNNFVLNSWAHIVATRSSNSLRFFVNGGQIGSTTTVTTNYSNSSGVYVGAYTGGAAPYYGYISNLRVVKGTAVYTAAFTPPTAPVTAISGTSLLLDSTNAGIYDATALNNMETVGNAQVSTTQAKWGSSSMYFDGTGDYLKFANNNAFAFGAGNFTVEYWIYPLSFSVNATVFDTRLTGSSTTGYSDYISITTGNFNLYLGNSTVFTSTFGLTLNTWTHIAVCRSGTSLRVFINGVQNGSTLTNSINMTDTACLVGTNRGTAAGSIGSAYVNGYIEDLRITKGVARYTANFTAPTAAFPTR